MKAVPTVEIEFDYKRSSSARAVRLLWNTIRLPIAGILLLLEPVVGFVCGLGLTLGAIASILFEMSAVGPRFPFLKVVGISLSFGAILFLYYCLVSIFVKD